MVGQSFTGRSGWNLQQKVVSCKRKRPICFMYSSVEQRSSAPRILSFVDSGPPMGMMIKPKQTLFFLLDLLGSNKHVSKARTDTAQELSRQESGFCLPVEWKMPSVKLTQDVGSKRKFHIVFVNKNFHPTKASLLVTCAKQLQDNPHFFPVCTFRAGMMTGAFLNCSSNENSCSEQQINAFVCHLAYVPNSSINIWYRRIDFKSLRISV